MNAKNKAFKKLFPDIRDDSLPKLRQAQLVMLRILRIIDYICNKNNIQYWLDAGTLLGAVRHKGFIPWDDDIDLAMKRDDYNKFLNICKTQLPSDLFLQTRLNSNYYNISVPLKIRDNNSLFIEKFEVVKKNYNQGIFVDIFVYDFLPSNKIKRSLLKYFTKKLCKLERAKVAPDGKYTSGFQYKLFSWIYPLKALQNKISKLIVNTNKNHSQTIGFGLDSNFIESYESKKIFPLSKVKFENYIFWAPKNVDYYLTHTYGKYMDLPPKNEQVPAHHIKLIPNLKKSTSNK